MDYVIMLGLVWVLLELTDRTSTSTESLVAKTVVMLGVSTALTVIYVAKQGAFT